MISTIRISVAKRPRNMFRVIEYFDMSLKVIRNDTLEYEEHVQVPIPFVTMSLSRTVIQR